MNKKPDRVNVFGTCFAVSFLLAIMIVSQADLNLFTGLLLPVLFAILSCFFASAIMTYLENLLILNSNCNREEINTGDNGQ